MTSLTALRNVIANLPLGRKLLAIQIAVVVSICAFSIVVLTLTAYYISGKYLIPSAVNRIQYILHTQAGHEPLSSSSEHTHNLLQSLLEPEDEIIQLGLYNPGGALIAQASQEQNLPPMPATLPRPGDDSDLHALTVLHPAEGELTVIAKASARLPQHFVLGITIAAPIMVLLILTLLLILNRLIQYLITAPILHLISIANTVSDGENYQVRAQKQFDDETGVLASTFNTMLNRIEARDLMLTSERDRAERAGQQAQALAHETSEANKSLEHEVRVRTRIEQELTGLQNFLSSIIDSMPSTLIAVDEQLLIQQWNNEAEKLFKVQRSDALSRPVNEVVPLLATHLPSIRSSITQNSIQSVEQLPLFASGEERTLEMIVYPLQGGQHAGAVIRIDDVSERLRMEEMVVQSEKMISVGQLAAGMAHEINNPLGAIIQSAQNIKRRVSPNLAKNIEVASQLGVDLERLNYYLKKREVLRFLGNIQDAGARASSIVNNVLQFSRRSNRMLVPTSLSELVRRTLEIAYSDLGIRSRIIRHEIEIVSELDESLEAVPCIPNELEQVLLNLVKNAAHAIFSRQDPDWKGLIKIRTRSEGAWAVISVEDNGVGMDAETRKRIFEPFFTTKEVGEGTGLGLSVSFFIIRNNHKGALTVQSTPGQGTEFSIRLRR
ncbi:HAMP domain-containing sensor histidine kinase [Aestuariirhabdus litorea]|uniref:histidine kinase n=1 Tax=Aestuariirhabdus litorea TaxID=2528527 RepID=A0A3P3VKQ0_9GAMM|nr:HAMP domain-containing sensor histidine kinase [Aestuariirhabdus litorea]RRJ83305.1 PAS domain S-box protein [Aestuariirhabdus litorea]RWW93465.1 PAS domain S-box protein [Endozoicomonadaceae bacterium GTF-13]